MTAPVRDGGENEAVYDVFFSYSWKNLAEALILVAALEARRLQVFRDETGMRDFDDIGTEVFAALAGSRSFVALYTPQFPESAYCRLELAHAMTAAYRLDGDVRRILPVVRELPYEAVRPRALQDKRLPARSTGPDALAAVVAERLEEIDDRPFGIASEPGPPNWYPFPTVAEPAFHGRATELWDLHDALAGRDDAAQPGQRLARIVGMGGQGKTMLAEQYARWFAADHPGGVFVLRGFGSHRNANSSPALLRTALEQQLARIAEELPGVPAEVEGRSADRSARSVIRDHLERADQDYLWIVDDLPDHVGPIGVREFLAPTARGRTLVTSRHAHRGFVGETVELGPLGESAAVRILLGGAGARADRATIASARRLAADLGHHAMAVALVARTLDNNGTAELDQVRTELADPDRDALEWAAAREHEIATDHQGSVAAAMMRSLARLSSAAYEVLLLASILAAAPVPAAMFDSVLGDSRRLDSTRPGMTVDDALRECAALALATVTVGTFGTLWSVHSLVSRAVRFRDRFGSGDREQLRARSVEALGEILERGRDGIVDYLPHVRAVAGGATDVAQQSLLNEAGRVQVGLGDERAALAMFERLYQACRESLGEDDFATQAGLVGLGVAYGLLGQHELALDFKTRAYEVLARVEGADEEATLTALNNVAVTFGELGDYAKARVLHRQIYATHLKRRGPSHPATLASLNAYATARELDGHESLALRLRTRVVAASRRYLRPDDPQLADAISSLAVSHYRAGNSAAARALFQEAYDVRRAIYGPSHPDALSALEFAAVCADPEARTAELRAVYRKRVTHADPGSPAARRTLRNLIINLRSVHVSTANPPSDSVNRVFSEPVQEPPGDWTEVAVRLDDETTDERVEDFELASYLHGALVAEFGTDHPETLFAETCLGHATVCLGQLDSQIDDGLNVLRDAAEGMRVVLGCPEADLAVVDRLIDWAERLAFDD
ncbi:TIR protein [Catenulispora acidiphila DSM 44928]|uniref:TIR protein n=1 Tax=Catenulispora acidiphila (strain DSM 44928 / JCM 14897 / NBRC 102108 / NRRL B-24433 / ID139908) TaxID=479433 RepID=C7QJ40_CATAD|nr:tetratricopeptide repeat protein [Catenulispora acidiphila]ACU69182.1 TIR protein [Catenulispora acidiphila DSM 44928]